MSPLGGFAQAYFTCESVGGFVSWLGTNLVLACESVSGFAVGDVD